MRIYQPAPVFYLRVENVPASGAVSKDKENTPTANKPVRKRQNPKKPWQDEEAGIIIYA